MHDFKEEQKKNFIAFRAAPLENTALKERMTIQYSRN